MTAATTQAHARTIGFQFLLRYVRRDLLGAEILSHRLAKRIHRPLLPAPPNPRALGLHLPKCPRVRRHRGAWPWRGRIPRLAEVLRLALPLPPRHDRLGRRALHFAVVVRRHLHGGRCPLPRELVLDGRRWRLRRLSFEQWRAILWRNRGVQICGIIQG